MKCLEQTLLYLAADEGETTALRVAQNLQLSLETIMEAGNRTEIDIAGNLLRRVNRALKEIVDGTLVELVRLGDKDAVNNEVLRRAGLTVYHTEEKEEETEPL
jgi:hypothetical protein